MAFVAQSISSNLFAHIWSAFIVLVEALLSLLSLLLLLLLFSLKGIVTLSDENLICVGVQKILSLSLAIFSFRFSYPKATNVNEANEKFQKSNDVILRILLRFFRQDKLIADFVG